MARATLSILSDALRVAFGNLGLFLSTQGVFILASVVISFVLSLAVPAMTFDAFLEAAIGERSFADAFREMAPAIAAMVAVGIVGFVLSLIGAGIGVVVADGLERGERLTLGESWKRFSPRFGNFLLTGLLMGLALMGVVLASLPLIFLVVPVFLALGVVVWLAVRWLPAFAVSALETNSPTGNLRRAWDLTRGSWWSIFGILLLFGLLLFAMSIPGFIAGMMLTPSADPFPTDPEAALDAAQPSLTAQVIQTALQAVVQLLSAAVFAVLTVRLYRTLAAPPADAPPPPPPMQLGAPPPY